MLAAVLLFGAGYVVAARNRLATWWATPNAPALSVPAMASEAGATTATGDEILERARQHLSDRADRKRRFGRSRALLPATHVVKRRMFCKRRPCERFALQRASNVPGVGGALRPQGSATR